MTEPMAGPIGPTAHRPWARALAHKWGTGHLNQALGPCHARSLTNMRPIIEKGIGTLLTYRCSFLS